jgi:hypothetical protein
MARALSGEGWNAIFTLCGGHVMSIDAGCRQEGVMKGHPSRDM